MSSESLYREANALILTSRSSEMVEIPSGPRRLGDRLIHEGLLTPEQLRIALELQKRTSKLLGEILVDLGFVEETVLSSLFSQDLGAAHLTSLEGVSVDPEATHLIPKEWALEHKVLPLSLEDNELIVAVTDPFDVITVDELRKKTGKRIRTVVASETEILRAVDFWYTGGQDPLREILQQAHEALGATGGGPAVEEAPLIRLVNHMLTMAAKDSATDVHLEPERNAVLVRFRVDGILKVWQILPKELERTLISRLKVMANLDISETRLPQDGRAEFRFGNRPLDLRVSVYPTSQGENVVIRILDRRKLVTRIDELGFNEELRKTLRRLLGRHQGIILVTGPTGSGKTTTLYASLMEIASPQINIMTIEDPIEYDLPFIRQSQINPRAQFTFVRGLRSILRQDPDVILVGEVRDQETLEIAMQAALTGHLVLSTLHTNSALGAIPRLIHMGAPSHILASSLLGVVSQRLLRRLCPECSVEEDATPEEERFLKESLGAEVDMPSPLRLPREKGCHHCRGDGYLGRFAVGEIVEVDRTLYHMISERNSEDAMYRMLQSRGYRNILQDGLMAVLKGKTTLQEIRRVL